MSFSVNVVHRGMCSVIKVVGELDLATAPQVGEALATVLETGASAVVFDLGELVFCDSTGLRVFVRAYQELDQRGGRLAIGGATDLVQRVLEVSGLAEIFGSYPTVAEAEAAVAA